MCSSPNLSILPNNKNIHPSVLYRFQHLSVNTRPSNVPPTASEVVSPASNRFRSSNEEQFRAQSVHRGPSVRELSNTPSDGFNVPHDNPIEDLARIEDLKSDLAPLRPCPSVSWN